MEKVYKRSEPRMLYRAPIWLRPADGHSSLVGETRNLSRRGMFVNIVPTPPLGTELLCELPGRREVRGRVAWVFNAAAPQAADLTGVGIEFVDLSEQEGSLVEDLVGVRLDENQPMNVWFAGLPTPTRSLGQVTHEGIELSTTLDFLRVGSEVSVAAPRAEDATDDPRLRGRIARVSLHTDSGPPRLAISLAVLAERATQRLEPDDERWFPDIIVVENEMIVEAESALVACAPEETLHAASDPRFKEASAFDRELAERVSSLPPSVVLEDGLVADASAPSATVDDESTERTVLEPVVEAPRPRRRIAPKAHASRRAQIMLFAGVAMVALVGMVAVRLVSLGAEPAGVAAPRVPAPMANEVAAATSPSPAPSPSPTPSPTPSLSPTPPPSPTPSLSPAPSPAPSPSAVNRQPPTDPVSRQPSPTPSPVAAAPLAARPSDATTPGAWHPQVTRTDDHPSVTVPITGSAHGLSTFVLTDPPGLAVDLPSAHAGTPLRPYLLHDAAFRSLWVRARPAGGLQIRLHVAPGVHVAADVSNGALRFRTR